MTHVTNPRDLPAKEHYAILTGGSVHVPGDERSRKNPGGSARLRTQWGRATPTCDPLRRTPIVVVDSARADGRRVLSGSCAVRARGGSARESFSNAPGGLRAVEPAGRSRQFCWGDVRCATLMSQECSAAERIP